MSQSLTVLSDDEQLFFDTVKDFAKEQLTAHAGPMDAAAKLDRAVAAIIADYRIARRLPRIDRCDWRSGFFFALMQLMTNT